MLPVKPDGNPDNHNCSTVLLTPRHLDHNLALFRYFHPAFDKETQPPWQHERIIQHKTNRHLIELSALPKENPVTSNDDNSSNAEYMNHQDKFASNLLLLESFCPISSNARSAQIPETTTLLYIMLQLQSVNDLCEWKPQSLCCFQFF